jgi:integrase
MLTPPEKASVKSEPIAAEHYRKLIEAVEDEPKGKAIFLLALNAATYPSEAAAVKKDDINLDEETLVMDRGKTGVLRVAVLWHRTVNAIGEYQSANRHQSEYVFVSRSGVPFSDNHITRNFSRRRDALGLPKSVQFAHIRDGAYHYSATWYQESSGTQEGS